MMLVKQRYFAVVDVIREAVKDKSQAKYLLRWWRSLKYNQASLNYELPWLTYGVIEWLEKNLKAKMKVFEWGSGGSTVYLAEKVKQIISVEHNQEWYIKTKRKLKQKKLIKKARLVYKNWDKYAGAINRFADESFEMVIVDGRQRNKCIKAAKRKVKKGGCLILDNSEQAKYQQGIKLLAGWQRQDFKGIGPFNSYSWQTTVWIRPVRQVV